MPLEPAMPDDAPLPDPSPAVLARHWYAHSEEGRCGSRAQHSVCVTADGDHACVAMAYGADEAAARMVAEHIASSHNELLALRKQLGAARQAIETFVAATAELGATDMALAATQAEQERDALHEVLVLVASGQVTWCQDCGHVAMWYYAGSPTFFGQPACDKHARGWGWRKAPQATKIRAALESRGHKNGRRTMSGSGSTEEIQAHLRDAVERVHPGATIRSEDEGRTLQVVGPNGEAIYDSWARGTTADEAARSLAASLGYPYVPAEARPAMERAREGASFKHPGSRVALADGDRQAYLIDSDGRPIAGAVGFGDDVAASLDALAAVLSAGVGEA